MTPREVQIIASLTFHGRRGYSFHKAADSGSVRTVQQEKCSISEDGLVHSRPLGAVSTGIRLLLSVLVCVVQDVHLEKGKGNKDPPEQMGQMMRSLGSNTVCSMVGYPDTKDTPSSNCSGEWCLEERDLKRARGQTRENSTQRCVCMCVSAGEG